MDNIYAEPQQGFSRHQRIEEELFQDHLDPFEAAFLHGYFEEDT